MNVSFQSRKSMIRPTLSKVYLVDSHQSWYICRPSIHIVIYLYNLLMLKGIP